jgi:transcriptional regulator GlxA family with amidase domain
LQIALVAYDDFTDIDVFLLWDLLNRVRRPDFQVRLVGERESHRSRTGVKVEMQGPLELANEADVVFVTSGPGSRVQMRNPSFLERLRLRPGPQRVGSICSGSLILAALGLLDGKRATTHPSARNELAAFPVQLVDASFVLDGAIASAAGCFAAVELATSPGRTSGRGSCVRSSRWAGRCRSERSLTCGAVG